MKNKTWYAILSCSVFALIIAVTLYPIYQMVVLSLMSESELNVFIAQVDNHSIRFVPFNAFPRDISFAQYRAVLTTQYARAFYMSFVFTMTIFLFQFIIAFTMGFIFAKTKFPGRDVVFFIYIMAMVLPFHVTLIPLNQTLHQMGFLNTPWAIILPGIFSPLGVFLFRQYIVQVPDDVLEASVIDGAGLFRIIVLIILPIIRSGIVVFTIITVAMHWGAVEGSLAFTQYERLQPVGILLRQEMANNVSRIFAPGVLYMIPILIMFIIFLIFAWDADNYIK